MCLVNMISKHLHMVYIMYLCFCMIFLQEVEQVYILTTFNVWRSERKLATTWALKISKVKVACKI